jgi:2-(1,2-epoxy-1,2-dihydrophenyl)acetyl-CoA isomerase
MLRTEMANRVLTLTLERPDAYNAIDAPLRDALVAGLDQARADRVAAVVIRGSGRGFSAGADLKEGAGNRTGAELMDHMQMSTQSLVRAVLDCPAPIVTAVHGVCAGVSLVLALGADHCIATRDARFAAPFVERALVPDGATTWLLPRLVGWARARRMLLFGESIAAPEALEIGMIGEVVDAEELDSAIQARTDRLASLPVATLRFTKGLLRRSFEIDLETLLFQERAGQGMMTATDDYREGVNAFLERRTPNFGQD